MFNDALREYFYAGYNITLAVQSARVLTLETHSSAECLESVYKPTQEILRKHIKRMPALSCFHGPPYSHHNFKGESADINIVIPGKRALHLGTVITEDHAEALFRWYMDTYKTTPQKIVILKKRGSMQIIRERNGCKIPVNSIRVEKQSLTQGVRRYMSTFVPQLASLPVVWMPEEIQENLCRAIWRKAEEIAKSQTGKEELEIILQDI